MAVWNLSFLLFIKAVTHAGLSDILKYKQELILFHVPSYLALNHTNLQASLRTRLKFSCYNESIRTNPLAASETKSNL